MHMRNTLPEKCSAQTLATIYSYAERVLLAPCIIYGLNNLVDGHRTRAYFREAQTTQSVPSFYSSLFDCELSYCVRDPGSLAKSYLHIGSVLCPQQYTIHLIEVIS